MKYILLGLFFNLSLNAAPLVHETDHFRVYTFDENRNRAEELLETVQKAYDAFEHYFGLVAEPVTIVAFPNSSLMLKTDLDAFEARGKLLPFVIEPLTDTKSDMKSSQLYPDLGMKLSQAEGAWIVDEVIDQLLMLNGLSGIETGDQIIQINQQQLTTNSDINELLAKVNKGDDIAVQVERGTANLAFKGRKLNLQTQQKKATEQNTESNQDKKRSPEVMLGALQHEIGHLLLIGVMNETDDANQERNTGALSSATYGSLKSPDWLDEMVANMVQGDAVKTIHRNSIKTIDDLIPLAELLQMRHPSVDSILATKAYQNRAKKDSKTQTIILSSDDFSAAELEQITSKTGTFYGSSLLFGEYLYHQGGSHLLSQIITITNTAQDASFESLIQQIESLENSIADIEKDFHQFVGLRLGFD